MIHIKEKVNREQPLIRFFISLVILGASLTILFTGTKTIAVKTGTEQIRILDQAIQRACIQCYAIEGRYPPSVEYLEEHYGLSIDRERYYVFYDGWASNIMPDITILPAEPSEE